MQEKVKNIYENVEGKLDSKRLHFIGRLIFVEAVMILGSINSYPINISHNNNNQLNTTELIPNSELSPTTTNNSPIGFNPDKSNQNIDLRSIGFNPNKTEPTTTLTN